MRAKNLVFLFVTLIFVVSSASAEIIVSQPKTLYSLGDTLEATIDLSEIKIAYLDINLICTGGHVNLYHNVPDSKSIKINRKLVPAIIGNVSGECYLSISYGDESKTSQTFKISRLINLELKQNSIEAFAGSEFALEGTAIKDNNVLLGLDGNAFVKAELNENISKGGIVKDGRFKIKFMTPQNMKAGKYILAIKVYDKDEDGNILNNVESSIILTLKQSPAKIDFALDKTSSNPGETVIIVPVIYDFAGDVMPGEIMLKIKDADGKMLYDSLISSGSEIALETRQNIAPGEVLITAKKDNITAEKSFRINELEKASAEIINETLIIKNVGNVPYNEIIQIKIGDETITKEVMLGLGEEIKYDLSAPDGAYDIEVKDNEMLLNLAGIALTGKAISAEEIRIRASDIFLKYPIVWIFIIMVIALATYVWYNKRVKKGAFSDYMKAKPAPKMAKKEPDNAISKEDLTAEKINIHGEIKKAEQVIALNGKRQPAAIIAIKLKNELEATAKENLLKSLEYIYRAKGVSYLSGNIVLGIFSPLTTKTFKNEERAIKTAMNLENYLKECNRKFKSKILFGIGVNSGEIINKLEGNIMKFTSIDKTINLAKKIADISSGEVLLSKDIHEKTMNSVKVEKNEKASSLGIEIFEIKRIVDSEENKKFIEAFLRRNNTK